MLYNLKFISIAFVLAKYQSLIIKLSYLLAFLDEYLALIIADKK